MQGLREMRIQNLLLWNSYSLATINARRITKLKKYYGWRLKLILRLMAIEKDSGVIEVRKS